MSFLRTIYRSRVWRRGHLSALFAQIYFRGRNARNETSDDVHLAAAADWLRRAQDATTDGGVAGRYRLRTGWSSSYPETTGYIVPTLLRLAERFGEDYHDRAGRCIEFLKSVQLDCGAFPVLRPEITG